MAVVDQAQLVRAKLLHTSAIHNRFLTTHCPVSSTYLAYFRTAKAKLVSFILALGPRLSVRNFATFLTFSNDQMEVPDAAYLPLHEQSDLEYGPDNASIDPFIKFNLSAAKSAHLEGSLAMPSES